ncbi:bifunctional folylpolyglutamate synthase/dihydrofolate synthase [Lignipirellula cremea]|uniref:Dihydrofolate synthase/folylpolyglutamate synthase n=1 Tax=Lignipirellula cremea TaxID=2528010 RepID=A0A518DUC4_9BACT|nr:folylpolyglutamate synthase/dihydrofolate synthase family protein [Lignipirellula cremea]QDU95440.1 Folylpolyglutamate synthase [Lignipirellula cremea]
MAIGSPSRATAFQFLWNRINYERVLDIPYRTGELKLDRMRDLLHLLGDPHVGLRCVHVAGTKGKGSTASMIASMLTASGLRTGMYTSPHLSRIEERYAIDGVICPEEEFLDLIVEVRPVVEQMDADPNRRAKPTFFEITTALGLLYFRRQKVDIAVIEVGLGGRLDSTNLVQPDVAVITTISHDHTRQLGAELAGIAREKAGIIKHGVPVVSGVLDPEAAPVIAAQAAAMEAPLRLRNREFSADDIRLAANGQPQFDYRSSGPLGPLAGLTSPLIGHHQAENAAVAISVMEVLSEGGWKIPVDAVRQGLARTACPARVELMRVEPTVVIDAAHNVASIRALVAALQACGACAKAQRRTLLFGASNDKDALGMLQLVIPHFDRIILTQSTDNPRAALPAKLAEMARQIAAELPHSPVVETNPSAAELFHTVIQPAAPEEMICVTGSFFLAGEIRSLLAKK